MPAWLTYSLLVVRLWGLWAFLPKLATRTLDATSVLFYQQVGAAVMAMAVLGSAHFRLKSEPRGIVWAVVTGALGVGGLLCYLQAAARYKISVVVMLTALYPLLTVFLSILILKERIAAIQWLGILFALAAIACMSVPTK